MRVTAFQWGWRFDYPSLNVGVAGETTNGPNNHGPQMVVPVGQTVQITLVSERRHPRLLRAGLQLQPLRPARRDQPSSTSTVINTGTYNGQCTQICGLYHSEMLFSVRAVSPPAFRIVGRRRGGQPATPCSARRVRPRTTRRPTPT